jgi:hypothetical protein
MDLLKETAIETIKRMPDGCIIEDIMYQIDIFSNHLRMNDPIRLHFQL